MVFEVLLVHHLPTNNVKYIVGGLQNPYSFTDTQYIFLWKYFPLHIKAEGMTQFDSFHTLVEEPAKIWNLSKNDHVWAA